MPSTRSRVVAPIAQPDRHAEPRPGQSVAGRSRCAVSNLGSSAGTWPRANIERGSLTECRQRSGQPNDGSSARGPSAHQARRAYRAVNGETILTRRFSIVGTGRAPGAEATIRGLAQSDVHGAD